MAQKYAKILEAEFLLTVKMMASSFVSSLTHAIEEI